MREILFKAKRVDTGEWVEGYPFPSIAGKELNRMTVFEPFPGGTVVNTYKIDPSTVCQYTGLKDKNGVRIFEGDILNMHGGCAEMGEREYDVQCHVVYYKSGRGANIGFSGLYESGMRVDLMSEYCLTVIGNGMK